MILLADAVSELQNAGSLAIQVANEATEWVRQMSIIWLTTLAVLLLSLKATK